MSRRNPVLTASVILAVGLCAMLATSEALTRLAAPPTPSDPPPAAAPETSGASPLKAALISPQTGLVCRSPPAVAARALKLSLGGLLARSGADPRALVVAPAPANSRYPATAPIGFTLSALMRPEAFLRILARIRTERPDIVLEHLELESRADNVRVDLAGEIVCWVGA